MPAVLPAAALPAAGLPAAALPDAAPSPPFADALFDARPADGFSPRLASPAAFAFGSPSAARRPSRAAATDASSAAMRSPMRVGSSLDRHLRCLAGHLGLDDPHQRLAVLVGVLVRVEVAGHAGDELFCHLPLAGLELHRLLGQLELLEGPDLVGPVQGGEEHRLRVRAERGELLAVLEDDLADRGLAAIGQDALEQVERLAPDLVRLQVVLLLHEAGRGLVRLARVDELLDLDGPDGLERDRLEVLLRDHDVLALAPLVAADRLRAGDHLVVERAVDLHLDPVQAALVEQVEADAGALGGQVQLHRDGDQAELDRPPPHGSRHGSPRFAAASSQCPGGSTRVGDYTPVQQVCRAWAMTDGGRPGRRHAATGVRRRYQARWGPFRHCRGRCAEATLAA